MKFYYYAILSITYLWGAVEAHGDASMRSMSSSSNTQFAPEAGEFSVVILGQENIAPGNFCNVNGGQFNEAGSDFINAGNYAVIGGGATNAAGPIFSTISGGRENFISRDVQIPQSISQPIFSFASTISGGDSNGISTNFVSSVITGGTKNRMCGGGFSFVTTKVCTISGGESNACVSDSGVATGGVNNRVFDSAAVAFGGADNLVNNMGRLGTSVGGENNVITGFCSIGLGRGTKVNNSNSMVINLNVPPPDNGDSFETAFDTDGDGQFIVNAKSYTFQIGKNDDDLSIQITEENIQNLIDALENAA